MNYEPCMDASMDSIPGQETKRPFPGKYYDAEHYIDDLEDRIGLDEDVERGGKKVPCNLWPEETFNCAADLYRGCDENHKACPVILDEFTHGERFERALE